MYLALNACLVILILNFTHVIEDTQSCIHVRFLQKSYSELAHTLLFCCCFCCCYIFYLECRLEAIPLEYTCIVIFLRRCVCLVSGITCAGSKTLRMMSRKYFCYFQTGRSIVANIMEGLDRSRRVILIVSKSFLESQWGEFETAQAQYLSIEKEQQVSFAFCRAPRGMYI